MCKTNNTLKDIIIIISTILCFFALHFSCKLNLLICTIFIPLYLICYYNLKKKGNSFYFIFKSLLIVLIVFNLISFIINKLNLLDYIGSVHEIKNFILSTGKWGIIIFCLIELLQVLILPIPAFITILAGVNIWGVMNTILICSSTVVLGSCIAFVIGKVWGVKAIITLVGTKKFSVYKGVLEKRAKLYLTLMFIFPFFPDDLLSLLAGTTNIKFYEFLLISFITRPISVIITALLGDYALILFQRYSIRTILLVLLIIILLLLILVKNKQKIKLYLKSMKSKKSS